MDYLFARTKGKRGSFYKVLSDKTVFDIPSLDNCRQYDDEYKLHEDEWFVINEFSEKEYCIEFLTITLAPVSYSFITKSDYPKIAFIVSIQEENFFLFQKVNPSSLYRRQKTISWENVIHPTDQAVLHTESDILVVKQEPDCIYDKLNNNLYFKNLSAITNIFPGINILYNEATDDEVNAFLSMDMIDISDEYGCGHVKTANRRRIKEATERYNSFTIEQKEMIPKYIGKYCSGLWNSETRKFNISNEDQLTDLLNTLNQRFYTTEIDQEKRLANSVTSL